MFYLIFSSNIYRYVERVRNLAPCLSRDSSTPPPMLRFVLKLDVGFPFPNVYVEDIFANFGP